MWPGEGKNLCRFRKKRKQSREKSKGRMGKHSRAYLERGLNTDRRKSRKKEDRDRGSPGEEEKAGKGLDVLK